MDFIEEKNCAFANICPKYFTALLLATDWHWVESKLRKAVTRNNQSISSGPKQCYSMWPWFQISLSHIRHQTIWKQSHTCWWWITGYRDIMINEKLRSQLLIDFIAKAPINDGNIKVPIQWQFHFLIVLTISSINSHNFQHLDQASPWTEDILRGEWILSALKTPSKQTKFWKLNWTSKLGLNYRNEAFSQAWWMSILCWKL